MKIHTGFHSSDNLPANRGGNRALPKPSSAQNSVQEHSKPTPDNSVKFEGYIEPDPSLGKANTSYQKQSAPQNPAPIGQYVDVQV